MSLVYFFKFYITLRISCSSPVVGEVHVLKLDLFVCLANRAKTVQPASLLWQCLLWHRTSVLKVSSRRPATLTSPSWKRLETQVFIGWPKNNNQSYRFGNSHFIIYMLLVKSNFIFTLKSHESKHNILFFLVC